MQKVLLLLRLDRNTWNDARVNDTNTMLGKIEPQGGSVEKCPIDFAEREGQARMPTSELHLASLPSRFVPGDQFCFVISADEKCTCPAHHIEHTQRVRTAGEKVSHEDELISGRKRQAIEKLF